jgi:hypothetical protein
MQELADNSGNTSITGPGNALIGAYLNGLSLSTDALLYITEAGPSEIRWLNVEKANQVGIYTQAEAPDAPALKATASVEPQPEQPNQQKQIYERIGPEEDANPAAPTLPKPVGSPEDQTDDPAPGSDRKFTIREGVDVLGLDLWHTQTADPQECQGKCKASLVCGSFTFNTQTHTCYIKQNVYMTYHHDDAISGYEVAQTQQLIQLPFRVLEGVDYPGHDYTELKDTKFRDCIRICSQDSRCKAFAYIQARKSCWLKKGTDVSVAKKGVSSGVKITK